MASRFGSRHRRSWLAGVLVALVWFVSLAGAASAAYTPATERIADDFRRDSALSACRHDAAALQAARTEVAADRTQGVPGLLGAIDAALAARNGGACGSADDEQDDAGAEATATPGATGQGGEDGTAQPGAATPEAAAGAAPTPGAVPTVPGGEAAPEPTPAPAPAASTPAPPVATAAPARAASTGDDMPAIVWILAGAALVLALLALLSLLLSRGRRGDEPLARTGHMWREAGYRLGSAWTDFSEWLRLGR